MGYWSPTCSANKERQPLGMQDYLDCGRVCPPNWFILIINEFSRVLLERIWAVRAVIFQRRQSYLGRLIRTTLEIPTHQASLTSIKPPKLTSGKEEIETLFDEVLSDSLIIECSVMLLANARQERGLCESYEASTLQARILQIGGQKASNRRWLKLEHLCCVWSRLLGSYHIARNTNTSSASHDVAFTRPVSPRAFQVTGHPGPWPACLGKYLPATSEASIVLRTYFTPHGHLPRSL